MPSPRALPAAAALTVLAACAGTSAAPIPDPVVDTSATEPTDDEALPHGRAWASAATEDAGGDAADAGPAVPSCAPEVEPNDTAAAGTIVVGCVAGSLATGRDRDYLRIAIPEGATTMRIAHVESARISYRVAPADGFGALFPTTFTGTAPPFTVAAGDTWTVRLAPSGGAADDARTYEVTVTFE